ncbi:hypothetical protein VHEMI04349 [[Torrubiella] hemipterigena]|uniref:Tat pathway signal sequence n=1 Tax=[Torrubiella] hemipterigena TaxID=1531966 RepID=A0A0A1T0Z6_9HYPO|nr:hypothetical protein VHEMI04349 [[Torrubiella] hemipterigena]
MDKQQYQDPATERLYASSNDEGSDYEGQRQTSSRWTSKSPRSFKQLIIGGYLVLTAICVFLGIENLRLQAKLRNYHPDLFPSIAKANVFHGDSRPFSLTVAGTVFAGEPSPELDAAWRDLLDNTTIRVSKEDLDYYNVTSLPFADGSGYASEIFMTHELHCLKKIRQWVYKEHYFEHVQGFARNELARHINHCIETLRQGIMCRGDVSLATYTYLGNASYVKGVTARTWGTHQCANFDAIMKWNRENAVDIFAPGVLIDPKITPESQFTPLKVPH